jgi:hypothetical protein
MENFGTVEHNGKTLTITQQPYITGTSEYSYYQAVAEDDEENEYLVSWEITHENPSECDDESNMCDWDDYTITEL